MTSSEQFQSSTDNHNAGDQFQQSWKSESFMGLLDLLHSESDGSGAQTTATNNINTASSNNAYPWMALDGSNDGEDWESEQLRSLLNLSDQDMYLLQGSVPYGPGGSGDGFHVDEAVTQAAPHADSSSMTIGQWMHRYGLLNNAQHQHEYQQQFLHLEQQQHQQSSLGSSITSSRRHSGTSLASNRQQATTTTFVTPSIPPPPLVEIKRSDIKESFVHPGFYSLSSPSQQSQRLSQQSQHQQQQQVIPVKMAMKRSFQEEDTCPSTTTSTTGSSPSLSPHRHRNHHNHGPMMDLRRHSVDGYHAAAKVAATAAVAAAATSVTGRGQASPAPSHTTSAWAYSTPPKTPNNLPTSKFHPHSHPHARVSTVDYSQVPPGQPFMATNPHGLVASPLMSHHHHHHQQHHYGGAHPVMSNCSSPSSSPFQPAAHLVRSLSSPAGAKLSSSTASAFNNPHSISTSSNSANGGSSGGNSNSGTPRKRRASKFRTDPTLSHASGASMIPFDPTALLSHFGLVNTLPPPLQQQHSTTTPQSEHVILYQQQQHQQLQAAIRRQQQLQQQHQHQQYAAAGRGGSSNTTVGQQNAHAFLMQRLVEADSRLPVTATTPTSTSAKHGLLLQQSITPATGAAATTYRRNPGEVPSSTLPPDHFIFQEASGLLNRHRQAAAQLHHAQQQAQAKQVQQAKQQAQQQSGGGGGGGRARSYSISRTTTGVTDGFSSSVSGNSKSGMLRRCSEPVNLYQQHLQQQQHQQQQPRLHHQHQKQHPQHHQHHHHQQQHLAMVVEANAPYASPVSTNSSSSPASSSSACESAIPCDPVITPITTTTITTAATAVGGIVSAGKKSNVHADSDMSSSIATTTTEAVKVGTTSTATTPESVTKSSPNLADREAEATDTDTDLPMPMSFITARAHETHAQKDIKLLGKEAPEQQEQVSEAKIEQDDRVVEQEQEQEHEEEKEEEEEKEPLSAAEEFAKSLTAVVTTTLDPAATQLMDQLRLQEYFRFPNSLPAGTPTAATTTTTPLGAKNELK